MDVQHLENTMSDFEKLQEALKIAYIMYNVENSEGYLINCYDDIDGYIIVTDEADGTEHQFRDTYLVATDWLFYSLQPVITNFTGE